MKLIAIGFATLIAIVGAVVVYVTHDKWKPYIEKTMHQPPRLLLVEGMGFIQSDEGETKIALDLGAGAGNETAYLLAKGFEVWAIDASPTSVDAIRKRPDLQSTNRLHVVQARFNEIDWSALPRLDLIVAISSLTFSEPAQFDNLWSHIATQLKPGGYFVGNFFGPKFSGFDEKDKVHMTWLDKDQVKNLFKGFSIILFREIDQPSESATGVKTHGHIFDVVAKRNI